MIPLIRFSSGSSGANRLLLVGGLYCSGVVVEDGVGGEVMEEVVELTTELFDELLPLQLPS